MMREQSTVPGTTRAGLQAVLGFLQPIYVDNLPDGRRVAALDEKGVQRIADGYACGECLAFFGRRFTDCPCCGHTLDTQGDIVDFLPDYWKAHEGRTSDQIIAETGI